MTLLILAGFYCSEGSPSAAPVSAVFGDVCPPGYYCESGSAVPTPCPVGTHNSESGGKGAEDCMPCPDGNALLELCRLTSRPHCYINHLMEL